MPKQEIDLKCPQCGAKCEWNSSTSTKVCQYCGYKKKYSGSTAERVINLVADKVKEKREWDDAVERRDREHREAESRKNDRLMLVLFFGPMLLLLLMGVLEKAGLL